ncbi:2348_t:CDS:1, partial [Funneliformis mosseae]
MTTFQKLPDSNMSYGFLQIDRGGNGKRSLGHDTGEKLAHPRKTYL